MFYKIWQIQNLQIKFILAYFLRDHKPIHSFFAGKGVFVWMYQPFSAIFDDPTIFKILDKLGILIQFTSKVNIVIIFTWEYDKITSLQHKKEKKILTETQHHLSLFLCAIPLS